MYYGKGFYYYAEFECSKVHRKVHGQRGESNHGGYRDHRC